MIGIKSTRAVVLLGSLLLTLVITGGLFAYAYTTATAIITVGEAAADFASVTDNGTFDVDYDLLGSVNGKIGSGVMFDVTGDSNYSGDVEVIVTLANADELVQEYRFWMLRLVFSDSTGNTLKDMQGITKIISLDNPSTSFAVQSANITGVTNYVYLKGGSYKAYPFALLGSSHSDPVIFCKVVQASQYLGTP